jgi:hypothetical protein
LKEKCANVKLNSQTEAKRAFSEFSEFDKIGNMISFMGKMENIGVANINI